MMQATEVRVKDVDLYFIPIETRVPLKFGTETLTSVTCVRVCLSVIDAAGRCIEGWGETPLSVQWIWPSSLAYHTRHTVLKDFCVRLRDAWTHVEVTGHAFEIGYTFITDRLPALLSEVNANYPHIEAMPWLAALVCCSAFDIALHDAYGKAVGRPIYETYTAEFMHRDLSAYLSDAEGSSERFAGKYPSDYLLTSPRMRLPAWHLVGGLDPLTERDLRGDEPDDGYPVLLSDWIRRDGLKCLKIKLRGNDATWDYDRLVNIGRIATELGVLWLTSDFNCTVTSPDYVNAILDKLMLDHPRIYSMLLYVEQPFPYDLGVHQLDVHSVSARKPLFMDESAHDWELVRLGQSLGWTGVALKTCKTQTGALLSLCWAKAHGMTLMVQDLTNPMLAQIPHILLAAHAGTIYGVETNAMQFYPEASRPEQAVHPGIYRRKNGVVDLGSINGKGFGYRIGEIKRDLDVYKVQV